MISLPPLLGYPEFPGMQAAIEGARADLDTLQLGGVDGVCLENDYDRPHRLTVGPDIIASFTRIAREVASCANVPVGLQILLNDWRASLAIAAAIDAAFVRLDFFVDKVRIQAGVIEPEPEAVIAYRKSLHAEHIALFTDIQVKYSELMEAGKTLTASARQAIASGADAIVVTGKITGESPALEDLKQVREAAGDFPVLVGSGTTPQNVSALLRYADGAIVGTALKDNSGYERVVLKRVKDLTNAARRP
jgi:membrane complex biogenesis BtpA family protein